MLNEREIRKKLYEQVDLFKHHYWRKEYAAAKQAYHRASTVAVFLELPEEEMAELFGNRAYKKEWEELKDGLFSEEKVEKASWECIRKNETYDNLLLRPRDPRYAGMYVKSWKEMGGGLVQVQLGIGDEKT